MGRSEWGVLVRSKDDVRRVLEAVQSHNEHTGDPNEVGEPLGVSCLLRFYELPFLCLNNGGGRTATSKWLWDRLGDMVVFWALKKPAGWQACDDYLWQAEGDESQPQNVPVDCLPLPDKCTDEPLPRMAVEVLDSWLTPKKPVTDVGAMLDVPGATGRDTGRNPRAGQVSPPEQSLTSRGQVV